MSEESLAVVRAIHEVLARGESPASAGLLHPDIEYVNPPGALEPGTRQGLAAYEDALRSIHEAFGDVRIEVREIKDVGDHVVVLATFVAEGISSGARRQHEEGYVWTVRDGRAIRFQWFNDPTKALKAVGLSE
jgi:ketosteroid isomerase-like protein